MISVCVLKSLPFSYPHFYSVLPPSRQHCHTYLVYSIVSQTSVTEDSIYLLAVSSLLLRRRCQVLETCMPCHHLPVRHHHLCLLVRLLVQLHRCTRFELLAMGQRLCPMALLRVCTPSELMTLHHDPASHSKLARAHPHSFQNKSILPGQIRARDFRLLKVHRDYMRDEDRPEDFPRGKNLIKNGVKNVFGAVLELEHLPHVLF